MPIYSRVLKAEIGTPYGTGLWSYFREEPQSLKGKLCATRLL